MNTAMTVSSTGNTIHLQNASAVDGMTTTSIGGIGDTATTGYMTIGGGYCYGCNGWPCHCNTNYHWYPSYSYTITRPDKAELLKTWLDGYMTDRKMSEKALKTIQKKIEEFIE